MIKVGHGFNTWPMIGAKLCSLFHMPLGRRRAQVRRNLHAPSFKDQC